MSVEVKTPTRNQFEHVEFMCGEKQSPKPGGTTPQQVQLEQGTTSSGSGKQLSTSGENVDPKVNTRLILSKTTTSDDESDCNKNYGRKRRNSQSQHGTGSAWIYKRRRHSYKGELPSQFLFGGNISDPLNLKSLCDDESVINQVTPQSSPLPAPLHRMRVDVFTPANIKDPLNLSAADDISPIVEKGANRKKKRKKSKPDTINTSTGDESVEESEIVLNLTDSFQGDTSMSAPPTTGIIMDTLATNRTRNVDKIVSPIVPHKKKVNISTELITSTELKFDDTVSIVVGKKRKRQRHKQSVDCDVLLATNQSDVVLNIPNVLESQTETVVPPRETNILGKEIDVSMQDSIYSVKIHSSTECSEIEDTPKQIKSVIVVPNPGQSPQKRVKRNSSGSKYAQAAKPQPLQQPKPLPRQHKFMYGNYDRYYGYRNPNDEDDNRITCLKSEWFTGKRVLDIGCNVGHVTLRIAYHFNPRKIIGMDIDGHLISVARKNIRHYMKGGSNKNKFPVSVCVDKGPLAASPTVEEGENPFPANVMFIQGNYVMESDHLLDTQQPEYDVILALSVTKWVHLNWGDDGLKRMFRRMFAHLKPGGRLILEAQAWSSYGKKKKLTETIFTNYQTIEFRPQHFRQYLLSCHVGFDRCQLIDIPHSHSKGFQRPMEMYIKAGDPSVSTPSSTLSTQTLSQPDVASQHIKPSTDIIHSHDITPTQDIAAASDITLTSDIVTTPNITPNVDIISSNITPTNDESGLAAMDFQNLTMPIKPPSQSIAIEIENSSSPVTRTTNESLQTVAIETGCTNETEYVAPLPGAVAMDTKESMTTKQEVTMETELLITNTVDKLVASSARTDTELVSGETTVAKSGNTDGSRTVNVYNITTENVDNSHTCNGN